ncbi:MAG: arginine deiminase-related protein [Fusobacterium sp. JB019]|nr:arginine deiminase-related protein [Fusobacterium sp. JB020]MDP0507425.1 arginine deiminase-related protein [Fusobacterium sp. JB019]
MSRQITNRVFMVKPIKFDYNKETAKDNIYQKNNNLKKEEIQKRALKEFELLVDKLKKNGVEVNVFKDTLLPETPDSIFPNNWFSSHEDSIAFYPMYAKNRREELKKFKESLLGLVDLEKIKKIDLSFKSFENKFLEGTGSLVLDRKFKKAYCCISKRSNKKLFLRTCKKLGYKPVCFKAYQQGSPIYHTNVLMSIGEKIALVCLEAIKSSKEREKVKKELLSSGKEIIEISLNQVLKYLGNILELQGENGNFIILSETAYNSLTVKQKQTILKFTRIVTSNVETIEHFGGGSVRCMIGELF